MKNIEICKLKSKETVILLFSISILFLLVLLTFNSIAYARVERQDFRAVTASNKKMLKLDYSSTKNIKTAATSNNTSNNNVSANLDNYVDTSAEEKKTAERVLRARRFNIENKYSKQDIKLATNGGEYLNSNSSSSAVVSPSLKKKKVKFSIIAEVDQTKSLVTHKDGGDHSSLDFAVYPDFTFNEFAILKFGLEGTQDQHDSEKSELSAGFIKISTTPLVMSDFFDWSPSAGFSLPVNKDQIDRKSLQASTSLGMLIMINQDRLPKNLSTGVQFLFGKYFHEYSTATNGEINFDYSARQVLVGNLKLSKWFALYAEFHHLSKVDLNGNSTDSFDSKEEIVISIDESWSLLVGHTNGGNVFKADGMSNNLALINENSSKMYLGMRANF